MTSTEIQTRTVEVSKEINASIDKVFKAWTEPEQMSRWFCMKDTTDVKVTQDLRVGGEYRIELSKGSDDMPILLTGVYKEVIPNKKLVYSWTNNSTAHPAKNTMITVEFIDKGKSTEVKIKHTNFDNEAAFSGHNTGWQAVLDNFASAFVG